jgi:hypothetical protein
MTGSKVLALTIISFALLTGQIEKLRPKEAFCRELASPSPYLATLGAPCRYHPAPTPPTHTSGPLLPSPSTQEGWGQAAPSLLVACPLQRCTSSASRSQLPSAQLWDA